MSKTPNQNGDTTGMRPYTGSRRSGFGPAFTAVTAAVGVGVDEMLSSGFTTGNAIGTAAGALGALVVTKVTDASVGEAAMIGALAGGIGVAVGRKIDVEYFTEQSELRLPPPTSGTKMIMDLF